MILLLSVPLAQDKEENLLDILRKKKNSYPLFPSAVISATMFTEKRSLMFFGFMKKYKFASFYKWRVSRLRMVKKDSKDF
jgi:hypothetical protein